ncbi:MAG: carotenoid oxygenase family protein [Actinomycetota bacterium]
MPTTVVHRVTPTIAPNDHPYLNGAWTPQYEEVDATGMEVIGEIPTDLDGIYVRNTENPVHDAIGVYHPFDGDGMLHAMSFRNGTATYRNRFVRTAGFLAEAEAGHALWAGLTGNPAKSMRPGWGARGDMKDASSTDVVVHAGEIVSTHYMCGEGYRFDPATMDQVGTANWVPPEGVSAHPKVDPATGELLFFNYGKQAPYMHYGVVGPDRKLAHLIPIELPGPRLPHDMAFTEHFSILVDLPYFWDEELLEAGFHVPRFHDHLPTRFAIVPRYGGPNEIRWFEADPTFVLHWNNAYEVGDEIVLDGYFQEDPDPAPLEAPGRDPRLAKIMAGVDERSFRPRLHRWRFDLSTGATTEERLDDRDLEFGMLNQRYAGRRNRYVYSTTTEPGLFLFNGIVKHDLDDGSSIELGFGPNRFGSEAPFCPRVGATAEDDGYLVSFVTDLDEARSECVIIDARDVAAGPICRIILPHQISSGTHATWASHDEIAAGLSAATARP